MDKKYERYSVRIQWSVPKDMYLATVPELVGCEAYGKTYEEAAKNLQEAIGIWIKEHQDTGSPIPEPNFWLDEAEDE